MSIAITSSNLILFSLLAAPMAYSIQGDISHILEASSKRPIREKKNSKTKRNYAEEIEWADFFIF